jgi:muramoyltetrapeptide carboxypeptidase
MIVPKKLTPGATIGIVAPARWPEPAWLAATTALFASKGYKTKLHPQLDLRAGQLAGSDAERAAAVNDFFADTTIDAIVCARGGTGSFRLVTDIDFDAIKRHPKIFCGFSDITTLLNAIHTHTGLTTFHGPMGWNFGTGTNPRTIDDFFAVLEGQKTSYTFAAPALHEGSASGKLIGGNMTLLQNLIGTPDDWNADDAILFIEDVSEHLYRLDRLLWHFKNAGKLQRVRAVMVGEMVDITDGDAGAPQPYGKNWPQLLQDVLPPSIPVVTNIPCGHGDYLTTLPIGAHVTLDVGAAETKLTLLKAAVR